MDYRIYSFDPNTNEPMNFVNGNITIKIYNSKTNEYLGGKTITISN